jgi:hypothetical protein
MRSKVALAFLVLLLCGGVAVQAATLRVVVVETSDEAAYLKGVEQGRQLLKSKGSQATIRVWKARFAGSDVGRIVVSVEYPNLEALAADTTRMSSDPDLKKWLDGLAKLRKVVSDSVYEEIAAP